MKHLRISLFTLLIVTGVSNVNAQSSWTKSTPWVIGLGGNVIDDDGNPLRKLFNITDSWNMLPNTSRLSIDKYYTKGWSFQAIFSVNKYTKGKIVKSDVNVYGKNFWSFDVNVKYDFNKLFGETGWFDPYITSGYGYTWRPLAFKNTDASNLGIGFNIWFYKSLGLNFQSLAKWTMRKGTSNYLQHSVGLVYKFGGDTYQTPAPDPAPDPVSTPTVTASTVTTTVSTPTVTASTVTTTVSTPTDTASTATTTASTQTTTTTSTTTTGSTTTITISINLFDYDKSVITEELKSELDKAVDFLKNANKKAKIEVAGHSDSKGSDQYNLALSKRRAEAVANYLASKGISRGRIKTVGNGESKPIASNENPDGSDNADGRAKNRRTEIVVVQ